MPSVATNTYAVSSIPYSGNYGPFNAGTNYNLTTDDVFGSLVTLPFTFCFYGQNFNTVVIGSNGIISFTAAPNSFLTWVVNTPIPSANYPNYSIMADYCDLYPHAADKIKYTTVGVAPNRKFVVNYNVIDYFFSTPSATFQIVLHETTNIVEVYLQYTPNLAGGVNAICGIQQNGTVALAAPGRNSPGAWSVLNTVASPSEAWRFTPTGGSSGGAPISVNLTTLSGLLIQPGVVVPNPPNYAATFTNICPTTDTSDYVVEAVYVTCAGNTTFKDTVRIIKTATPPPTVTSPVIVCQNSIPGPLQAVGSNLLWYTQAVGGTGSPLTPTPNTSLAGLDTFWVTQTLNGCESIRVPIYITVNPTPTIAASSNSPICAGQTLNLLATQIIGATYQWTGPNIFNATVYNPSIAGAQPVNAGTYSVTATITTIINGISYPCSSTQATTTVQILPNPFIAFASAQSATTCTGFGQITLSGLTPNTQYTVNYSKNGVPQPPIVITSTNVGQVIIPNLGPGTYTAITVTLGNCISNTMAGPYTINNPPVGATIAETHINPTTCGGSNGSITLTGLTNGVTYAINYTKNGVPQPVINQVATGGSVTIPNLTAGTYTNISVTIVSNGCVSNVIASVVLVDPNGTNITVTFTNPTSCNSNTGSITINGLTNGSNYTINYIKNGTPQAPISFTASGTSYTIPNLGAGNYTGITVTLNGCVSNVATATLVDPTPPNITIVANNPNSCIVNNGSIVISGLTTGTSYTINYIKNGVAQAPITQTAVSGSVTIPNLGAGNYTGITVTVNGCTSNAAIANLVAPTPPVIAVTFTSPTGCNTNNGSIVISGLANGSSYTINYIKNGVAQTPITQTASGGTVTIPNLGAGNYTGITVTINGCVSNATAATLIDPPGPVIAFIANNPTACATATGSILLTGLTNGSSYIINYSKNGTPQAPITQTASGGSVTIGSLTSGTYSNITVTLNGCVSNILGPITLFDPSAPATPTVTGNSPLCPGQTLNLNANSTTPGVTYQWVGPPPFTAVGPSQTITNIQPGQAGLYSVTASLNGCTSAAGTFTLIVNPAPAQPNAGPNLTVCEGSPINLTASTTTPNVTAWHWTSNTVPPFNSNLQNPTITPATPANSGSYYVTDTALGCGSIADTVVVTVVPTPAIQFTANNPTTCGGTNGSIVLNTLTNGSSYVINYTKNGVPQTAITQVAAGGTVTIPNLSAGTYTNISVTLNGCPSNTVGPVLITDPNLPPTPVATVGGIVCEGDTLFLFASTVAGATYTWTSNTTPVFNSGVQNPTINPVTLAANGTYSVTATVAGCTSLPGTVLVDIKPLPAVPTLTSNAPICEGDILSLNANTISGATSYDWSGPQGFASTSEDTSISNAQANNSGAYTLVVGNGYCSSTNTINVVVNPIPGAPTVVSPTEVCQNTTHQLTAQGQNLLWYTTATGGTGVASMNANTTNATTITYYVSQTINGCEGPRTPIDIVVKPQPAPPVAQTGYVYCQFDNATQLTATGIGILWYDAGMNQLPGAPTPSTLVAGPQTYYVTQTDNGCKSDETQVDVMVNAKPGLPVVEQLTLCQDDPIPTLNAQGQNLKWYDSATGGTGSLVTPTVYTTDTGVFDFYVSQTVNNCESDRALLRVTVNPKVVADFSTDKDTVCDSYPLNVTFTGVAPQGATYDWNFDGASEVTGTGAGPYVVVWSSEGVRTITLTVTNLNCTSTISKTIHVLPTLEPNFDLPLDACIDEEVRVQVGWDQMNLPGYEWNFYDAILVEGTPGTPGPYTLKWNSTGQHHISLSLTNIPCPSLPRFDTINIHQPVAKIESIGQTEICTSDSVLFTAQPGLDYQYHWAPAAFFGDINENMSMWGTVKKASYVTLTVTDRWGCTNADSVLIEPKSCCEVFLPNTFTPNGDGKNDVFRMVTNGNQEISVFIIVDRWGKRVFESVNQYEAWDGSFNGEAQDIGTYQYYLRYRCADTKEIVEMKGDVILLR
jgi:gliding motility-associated-like protein